MIPLTVLSRSARRARRRVFEAAGSARYSRPALYEIDRKLERHMDFDRGVFVEAGANDGYVQSNTYYFEKMRGWAGVLIEPVPQLAAACRNIRRGPVFEAALVESAEPGTTVELHWAGLMSTLTGALGDSAVTATHVEAGIKVQQLAGSWRLRVAARTLSAILDEAGIGSHIDLLSLDVEGGEPAALRGLDWSRHAPRFICVEARDPVAIAALLEPRYDLVEVLTDLGTYRDLLYGRR